MEQEFINKTKAFVASHLKDDYSLNELAQYIGFSAYHLTREFKNVTGLSLMEYVREQKVYAAAKELANGCSVCDVAMDYGFDTHAGFTRGFVSIIGCTPKQYAAHAKNANLKGAISMGNSSIVIRHICKDDVHDLWENVYSAMTPRQITEEKILPSIEAYKKHEGLQLVAVVEEKVVMALPMTKPYWCPFGFLFDNNFVLTGGYEDNIMKKLLEEMISHAKMMGISTLIVPEGENSKNTEAFESLGFTKVFTSSGWDYLMMAI